MALKVGMIGAGVVGTAVGVILMAKGYEVTGAFDIEPESTDTWNRLTGTRVFTAPEELVRQVDVVFITTNDGAIAGVVDGLMDHEAVNPGQIFIHMSGALTSDVMQAVREQDAIALSLHPLQSFANVERAIANLPGSIFSIEGDETGHEIATQLVSALGGEYFFIAKEAKPIYHAGACVVSNYLVTLIDFGTRFLESTGMPPQTAQKALMPLIQGTINNIERMGIPRALTGPIARGDLTTVVKHLSCLDNMAPELTKLYSWLGYYTAEIAERKGSINRDKMDDFKLLFAEWMNTTGLGQAQRRV
ncbi:MAG: Rossmann-like and DUF2520 domain-containing protein [Methylocystaceae bacterium]